MHILIFGATDVGYMIASRMYQEHDVTLVDDIKELPERFNSLDISFVRGSGADIATLQQANISKSGIFIACSRLDEANIVACWSVKKLIDLETICFVGQEAIYRNLVSSVDSKYHTKYDIDTLIWPEYLLTEDIFRIVLVPEAVDVEYFDGGAAKLFELPIRETSPLSGVRIRDYAFPRDVLIVGIYREGEVFIPKGDSRLIPGDKAVFMGKGPALDMLVAKVFPQEYRVRSVGVIGGGNVGYFLAQKLEQSGLRVKIVENSPARCEFLAENLSRSLVLNADGTDLSVLEDEDFGEADVVVCVTDNDEKNLLCSLLVKQLGSKRVITRVENLHNANLFERVGIDVVVSPWDSAMKELLNQIRTRDVDVLALIERGVGEVLKLTVPDNFRETKVLELAIPEEAVIGLVKRRRNYIIPNGSTLIRPGDQLKIFTKAKNKEALHTLFTL